jgi:hypothetical protein
MFIEAGHCHDGREDFYLHLRFVQVKAGALATRMSEGVSKTTESWAGSSREYPDEAR